MAGAAVFFAGLVSLFLAGCGDESRRDGSQVQISEETKAQIQDMRDTYKDLGKNKRKKN
jgi:hypothetical protein